MSRPKSKSLIIHTGGGIGDVLQATGVVDALAQAGHQVDFLCQKSTAPALEGNPQLGQIFRWPGRGPGGLRAWWNWVKFLRIQRYQQVLVLWSTTAVAWLAWSSGIPLRVGQDSRLSYSFLYNRPVRLRSERGDTSSHWSEILLDSVRALGLQPGPARVNFTISAQAEQQAQSLLQSLPGSGPLIGFHAFKGPPVALERWPLEIFADWVRQMCQELGARVVLTGSPAEKPYAAKIQELAGVSQCFNLAGQTDLGGLAALTRLCQVFVCPDSGPMHLAAAAGAKVLGIYALEEDFPQRWAPLTPRGRILRPSPLGCPPGCRKPTCPDFRCYRQVSTQDLLRQIRAMLSEP